MEGARLGGGGGVPAADAREGGEGARLGGAGARLAPAGRGGGGGGGAEGRTPGGRGVGGTGAFDRLGGGGRETARDVRGASLLGASTSGAGAAVPGPLRGGLASLLAAP